MTSCEENGVGSRSIGAARIVRKLVKLAFVGALVMDAVLRWLRIREGGYEMLLIREPNPHGQSSDASIESPKDIPSDVSSRQSSL